MIQHCFSSNYYSEIKVLSIIVHFSSRLSWSMSACVIQEGVKTVRHLPAWPPKQSLWRVRRYPRAHPSSEVRGDLCWWQWPYFVDAPIQYSTIQYNTVQYNTIQFSLLQYNTIQYSTVHYNTIQYNFILYYAMLCYAMLYYTILYYTILYYTIL